VGLVVEVTGSAILAKEMVSVKIEPSANSRLKLARFKQMARLAQGAQVVARMKIVDPLLRGLLAVCPRAITALAGSGISSKLQRGIGTPLVAGKSADAGQERGAQEIRGVDLMPHLRQGITQAGDAAVLCPVEFVQNVLGGACSDGAALLVASPIIEVQQ